MPKNYDFSEMVNLISPARLTSYNSAFSVTEPAETFGLYAWNLELSGALSSLIQLVEVALRNAINEAGKRCISTSPHHHWFESVPHHLVSGSSVLRDITHSLIKSKQTKEFESGFAKARKSAQKLLKKKLGENTSAVATLDQIIAQTDFSVWESILDKSYYDGDAKKGFLWPRGFLLAFKRLPVVSGKNKQFQQRDIIRRRVESIRMIRNRVAHNEPIWKGIDLSDKSKIIENLWREINDILELTYWISPSLNTFIRNSSLMHRLKMIICEHEIKNATYRNVSAEISNMNELHHTLKESAKHDIRISITANALQAILYCKKHRFY